MTIVVLYGWTNCTKTEQTITDYNILKKGTKSKIVLTKGLLNYIFYINKTNYHKHNRKYCQKKRKTVGNYNNPYNKI